MFQKHKASSSGEQGAPAPTHPCEEGELEAAVERLQLGVADEVDHVEILEPGEHAAHELAADPAALPVGQHRQQGDEGADNAVADRRHEADDSAVVTLAWSTT